MVQTRSASGLTPARASSSALSAPNTPSRASSRAPAWAHVPSLAVLAWMAVSLPLVAWDTGYVLGRPLTMPGGRLHWPLWVPYELYGEVDHMYGFKQWHAGNGFTAAQGTLNLLETLLYAAYVWLWYARGRVLPGARYAGRKGVTGRAGAFAVLLGFSAAVMTVSKTLLYWLNEYFSNFDNIGHNSLSNLVFLWIIPNGAWLVVPSLMIYQLGEDIIAAITLASGRASKSD